jgi:hypothetical protein
MTKSRVNNADGHGPSVNNEDCNVKEEQQKIKSSAVQQRNASGQEGDTALAKEQEELVKCELI